MPGLEIGRREAGEIAEQRRYIWFAQVMSVGIEQIHGHQRRQDVVELQVGMKGITRLGEVHLRGAKNQSRRHRQALVFGPKDQRSRQVPAGRTAANENVGGRTFRERLAENGDTVVETGWEGVQRRHAIVDRPGDHGTSESAPRGHELAYVAAAHDQRSPVDVDVDRCVGIVGHLARAENVRGDPVSSNSLRSRGRSVGNADSRRLKISVSRLDIADPSGDIV